jgi:hypothetical protein
MLLATDEDVMTIRGTVTGAPDTTVAITTDTGCIARAAIDSSGVGDVQWTGPGADFRFVLIEVRHISRTRMRPMAALTNPAWITRRTA